MSLWDLLSDEVFIIIFGFLSWKDLPRLRLVCSHWHCLSQDEALRKRLVSVFEPNEKDLTSNDGIVYWFGIKGGTRPWKNPAEKLRLTLSTSHRIFVSSSLVEPFADVPPKDAYFSTSPHPWFSIDVSPFQVIPTHYKLKNGGGRGCCMVDWAFEGRPAGDKPWEIIREHPADRTFKSDGTNGYGTHVFEVKSDKGFAAFRIRQKNDVAFFVHRFELYGKLFIPSKAKT